MYSSWIRAVTKGIDSFLGSCQFEIKEKIEKKNEARGKRQEAREEETLDRDQRQKGMDRAEKRIDEREDDQKGPAEGI